MSFSFSSYPYLNTETSCDANDGLFILIKTILGRIIGLRTYEYILGMPSLKDSRDGNIVHDVTYTSSVGRANMTSC